MTILDDILASTRTRVEAMRAAAPPVLDGLTPPRPFAAALAGPGVAVVAEIKRRSPSRGPLDLHLDASSLAETYAAGGAAALSVLTEPDFFSGSLEDLVAASSAGIPVLLKDFVIDPIQIEVGRGHGADAVLLIVRIVGGNLPSLMKAAASLGMDALVEVHDEADVARALDAGATLIGINHRDLATFDVDPGRTERLYPLLPADGVVVSLSGVTTRAEVARLEELGVDAVLVGESAITSEDPGGKIEELLGAKR